MREIRERDGRPVLDFGAGIAAVHTQWLRSFGVACVAYDIGANYDPAVHDRNALLRDYRVVFASNVVNTQATIHGALRTLAEIAFASEFAQVVLNLPDSPRKCADVTVKWVDRMLCLQFHEVDPMWRYSGGAYWTCRGPKLDHVRQLLTNLGPLTREEIEACNIRPVGAVGRRAIVPRVVARILGVGEEVAA